MRISSLVFGSCKRLLVWVWQVGSLLVTAEMRYFSSFFGSCHSMSCFRWMSKLVSWGLQYGTFSPVPDVKQSLGSSLWHHPVLFEGIHAAVRGYLHSAGSWRSDFCKSYISDFCKGRRDWSWDNFETNRRPWLLKRTPELSPEKQRASLCWTLI